MPPKQPRAALFLLLCGLPASGKSTFAEHLVAKCGGAAKLELVSSDAAGSTDQVKKLLAKALKHGKSVVLDRCNASDKERRMFVREANELSPASNVEVVFFSTPPDVCEARGSRRTGHPTLAAQDVGKVVGYFASTFRVPMMSEGPYTAVHMVDLSDIDAAKPRLAELTLRFQALIDGTGKMPKRTDKDVLVPPPWIGGGRGSGRSHYEEQQYVDDDGGYAAPDDAGDAAAAAEDCGAAAAATSADPSAADAEAA